MSIIVYGSIHKHIEKQYNDEYFNEAGSFREIARSAAKQFQQDHPGVTLETVEYGDHVFRVLGYCESCSAPVLEGDKQPYSDVVICPTCLKE